MPGSGTIVPASFGACLDRGDNGCDLAAFADAGTAIVSEVSKA